MGISEIILIINIGFSPGGASGTALEVLEYVQPNAETCKQNKKIIDSEFRKNGFYYTAICMSRIKGK